MKATTSRWMIAGIIIAAAIILMIGTLLIAGFFFFEGPMMGWQNGWRGWIPFTGNFESNGERIYFTGTSQTGPTISAQMPGMHRMPTGRMACADCHGADGRGGTVRMMMSRFDAPDIRYSTLTEGEHGDAHGDHPPYTDEDIKRAITDGLDSAGEPLEWLMPRWTMTDEQLEDLIKFLMTLD
jgi:cytochrome c oxidase subunit II